MPVMRRPPDTAGKSAHFLRDGLGSELARFAEVPKNFARESSIDSISAKPKVATTWRNVCPLSRRSVTATLRPDDSRQTEGRMRRSSNVPPLSRFARTAIIIAGCLAMNLGIQAHAAVSQGDHFVFHWQETGGAHTGAVDLTVGAPLPPPPPVFFSIDSFVVTQQGGFCGVCTPMSEDLSGAVFNSTTLGLIGEITGTFDQQSELHSFVLTLTDTVGGQPGTWIFEDSCDDCETDTTRGTYVVVAAPVVPEPTTLMLLGSGLVALVGRAAWRKRGQA